MATNKITAQKSLRINTTIYRPGEVVKASDLAKLPEAERQALFADGKLSGGGEAGETEPAGPELSRDYLASQTKAYTEQLLTDAGIDPEQWSGLNKEPLIDFALSELSDDS